MHLDDVVFSPSLMEIYSHVLKISLELGQNLLRYSNDLRLELLTIQGTC